MTPSNLNFYSLGIVAKDKTEHGWDIEVYPIEKYPNATGNLAQDTPSSGSVTTNAGEHVNYNVNKSKTITCSWLPMFGGNVNTPPSVMKGETVMIINFAEMDMYFWACVKVDYNLRKKENFIIFLSNKSDIGNESSPDKGYWFAMDTYNKLIKLHTSKTDGEKAAYDLDIRPRDGCVKLWDDKGNYILFDSIEKTLTVNMGKGYTLNAKEIIETNTKDTIHNSESSFNINTDNCNIVCKSAVINADSSVDVTTKNCNINGSSKVSIQGGNIELNGSSSIKGSTSNCQFSGSVIKLN